MDGEIEKFVLAIKGHGGKCIDCGEQLICIPGGKIYSFQYYITHTIWAI